MSLGHTGRKVGKQQKESAEITSTTSFNTSQDHVQTGIQVLLSQLSHLHLVKNLFQFKMATESRYL